MIKRLQFSLFDINGLSEPIIFLASNARSTVDDSSNIITFICSRKASFKSFLTSNVGLLLLRGTGGKFSRNFSLLYSIWISSDRVAVLDVQRGLKFDKSLRPQFGLQGWYKIELNEQSPLQLVLAEFLFFSTFHGIAERTYTMQLPRPLQIGMQHALRHSEIKKTFFKCLKK